MKVKLFQNMFGKETLSQWQPAVYASRDGVSSQ